MSKYRHHLPQLAERLFLTDAGLETELVFKRGIELPEFAAFHLLRDADGRTILRDYFERFIRLAHSHDMGAVLETPTWRASRDWGARIGYDAAALARVNRQAVALLSALRDAHEREDTPIVVSGNLGPRADGYSVRAPMSASEAEAYHTEQVDTFTRAGADMVSALTLNYVEEAVGIVRAARASAIPVAISFTVETDGRLPAGQGLAEAMQATDEATGDYAAYFMVNCAHPSHFEEALAALGESRERIRGIRANASRRSHAELDVSTELDEGDPEDLAAGYRRLSRLLPRLSVVGGCCGTDQRHVGAICSALAA